MEVVVVEDKKNKLVVDIEGESHTLANAIRKELWSDSHVKAAAYAVEHPLIEKPRIIVETDGADPRKALQAAAKRVQKQLDKVKADAKKLK